MPLVKLYAQMLGFAVVTLGPLPLALALARAGFPPAGRGTAKESSSRSHILLTGGILWVLIQAALAQALLFTHTFTWVPLLISESLLLSTGLLMRRRSVSLAPAAPLGTDERLFLAALGGLAALLLYLCSTRPVTDWDSLAYHLPAMAEWIQHRGYVLTPAFRHDQIGAYPYSWEAILGCGLLIFHHDFLVLIPNLLAWALLGLAVYRLSCQLGASRRAGLVAVLLLLSQPLVIEQVGTLHIDLPFAAFFLAGVYYITRYVHGGSSADLVLSCACMGLLLALKMSGVPYAGLLIGAGLGLRLMQSRRKTIAMPPHAGPPSKGFTLAVLLGTLWVGAFWYALNLQRLGNPLGYVPVRLGSHILFAGVPTFLEQVQRTTLAHLFHFRQVEHLRVLAKVMGYHLELPFVLLSGMVAAALWQRRRVGWPLFLCAACALIFWRTPYSGDNGQNGFQITTWIGQSLRYALPALGLWAVSAALGAERIPLLWTRTGRLMLALAPLLIAASRVSFVEWLGRHGLKVDSSAGMRLLLISMVVPLVAALALAAAGAVTARLIAGSGAAGRADWFVRWTRPVAAALALGLLAAIPWAFEEHGRLRRESYGATAALLDQLAPDEAVGFFPGALSYPLYGERLQRQVVPLAMPNSPAALLAQARAARLRLLVVDPVPEGPAAGTPRGRLLGWLQDPERKTWALSTADPTRQQTAYRLPMEEPIATTGERESRRRSVTAGGTWRSRGTYGFIWRR